MQSAASHSSRDSRFSQVKRRIMLNLLALGFNSQHLENKYSCRLDDHMFDKPNKRAFEVVFHFLFCQLDRPQAEQLFRLCFPGTDKQSTQEFRKRTYTWLKRIAEENGHSGLSKFSPTLFMSPGGKDFIYLVFAFTQFVLLKLCQAKLPSSHALHRPILSKNRRLASVQQTSLQALASKCHKEHIQDLQLIDKTDRDIHLHFQEQQNSYHKLQREKASLMQKRTKDKRKLMSESKKQEELEHHCRETKSKCKQVRGMWSKLTNTVAETRPHSEVLSSVYNERNLKLEADKLKLNIPSRLVNEYQEEMYQAVGSSLYQFGKVNLQSIVSVCNFSFMLLGDNLRKFGVPNFESQIPFVKIQSGLHKEELLKIYDIRSEIICLNDSATRNIEQMETILDEKYKFNLSTSNVLNTAEYGELSYAPNNDTLTMSNQTSLLDTSDESGNSLPLKYLLPAGHDVSSFLSHYVSEPEEQSQQNTTPNVTTHAATQLKPKQTKARSKNKPFSSKFLNSTLVQGNTHQQLHYRLSASLSMRGSNTPGRYSSPRTSTKSKSTKSKSRKSMSLPSSPLIRRSAAPHDVSTIKEPPSRTPDCEMKLIDQIVNETINDTLISPCFVYNLNQLDRSAFVSADKVARTPPVISNESSDVASDSDFDKKHQKSIDKNAPFEFSTAVETNNPTPLITDSQSNSDKDDDINQQSSESSVSSKRDKTPEIIEFDDSLSSVSALESSGILVEEPVSGKTVFFDSLDEETDSTSHLPQSVEAAPAVSKMVEFNINILPEFDLIQGTPGGELADVMPTRQQVELEMMSKWETQGGATILDVSNLSLADLDESDESDDEPTEQNEACDLIVFDEEPETIQPSIPTGNLIDPLIDSPRENASPLPPCGMQNADLLADFEVPHDRPSLQEIPTNLLLFTPDVRKHHSVFKS